jgi:hypothetical protein
MKHYIGKKVLVTTSEWFYAPDGKSYRAVHGTFRTTYLADEILGGSAGRDHANWLLEIGDMVIAGCQVNYIIQCDEVNTEPAVEWTSIETQPMANYNLATDTLQKIADAPQPVNTAKEFLRPTAIYKTT